MVPYIENSSVSDLDFKQSVRVATTANITLSGTQTIDGVSLSLDNRVLVKDQTDSTQNGIYLVKSSSWIRSLDSNKDSEISSGMIVYIEEGTINAKSFWYLSTQNPISVGTTSLLFKEVYNSPSTELLATNGIELTYNSQNDTLTIFGSNSLIYFTAQDNQPPATSAAQSETRNSIPILSFDSSVQENAVFMGILPDKTIVSSGLLVRLWWMAATATSGEVRWQAQFEKEGSNNNADSFDTASIVTASANSTSGIETMTDITCSNLDGLTENKRFRLKISRVPSDILDTMVGDAQLIALEVRSIY